MKNSFFILTFFLFSMLFILPNQTIHLSSVTASANGCGKPIPTWLYPSNGFNLSQEVTIFWLKADPEYYETVGHSLYFNSSEGDLTTLQRGIDTNNYTLNTTLLPEGAGYLIIEGFDGYYIGKDYVEVNIYQNRTTTPLDQSVLDRYYACEIEEIISSIENSITKKTTEYAFFPLLVIGLSFYFFRKYR